MNKNKDEYMTLLIGMATDELLGRGPTPMAMVSNLRAISDHLEKMLPDSHDEEGGSDGK